MSLKDRRERQKQATRDGILNAALQIAKTDGWMAVTIRRVADLIEYSPPIIYEYFVSKDALLEALQEQGFALLATMTRQASTEEADPRERLLRVGDAYLRFAYEQPELYQLMHGWNSAAIPLDRTLARATEVGNIVQECLEAWAGAEEVALSDPAAALETAWALLHGLVSIEMLGRIGGGKERVRQLMRQGFEDLLTARASR